MNSLIFKTAITLLPLLFIITTSFFASPSVSADDEQRFPLVKCSRLRPSFEAITSSIKVSITYTFTVMNINTPLAQLEVDVVGDSLKQFESYLTAFQKEFKESASLTPSANHKEYMRQLSQEKNQHDILFNKVHQERLRILTSVQSTTGFQEKSEIATVKARDIILARAPDEFYAKKVVDVPVSKPPIGRQADFKAPTTVKKERATKKMTIVAVLTGDGDFDLSKEIPVLTDLDSETEKQILEDQLNREQERQQKQQLQEEDEDVEVEIENEEEKNGKEGGQKKSPNTVFGTLKLIPKNNTDQDNG